MASRAASLNAMVGRLDDDLWVQALVDNAYSAIYTGQPTVRQTTHACKHICEAQLHHIGALVKHATHTARGPDCRAFTDVANLLGDPEVAMVHDQILAYAKVSIGSVRVDASDTPTRRDNWADYLDGFPTLDEMDRSEHFDKLRQFIGSTCATRRGSHTGGGAGGGGGGSVRLTQPKMSKMSKSVVDRAAQYRHLRTLYNSSSDDQTEMALEDALVEQEKLLADFQLYKEGRNGRSEAEWTALSQSERVKEWLVLAMKRLNATAIAAEELQYATQYTQSRNVSIEDYLSEIDRRIKSAKLSHYIAYGRLPREFADESAECKTIVAGLLPRLRGYLKSNHTTKVAEHKTTGAPLPDGYEVEGFTSVDLVAELSKGFATDHNLNADNSPRTPTAASPGDGSAPLYSKNTLRRVAKERAAFVAAAEAAGDVTPHGYAMVASEFVLHHEPGSDKPTPYAAPCVNAEQVKALNFPPLLVKRDGKPAPITVQICKYTWLGRKCSHPPDSCQRRRITREEFLEELQANPDGEYVPHVPNSQAPPSPSPSGSAMSSVTSSTTQDDRRISLLEEQVKAQVDTLADIKASVDMLRASAGGSPEADAVARRRAAVAQKKATAHAALRDIQAEMAALAALEDELGAPESKPRASMAIPSMDEFWSESMLASAGQLIMKATGQAKNGQQGVPLSTLTFPSHLVKDARIEVEVMWDTGCSPSGLMCIEVLHKWAAEGFVPQIDYFDQPKTIGGVGKQPVLLLGTVNLHLQYGSRALFVQAGVMSNGNTGMCDVLVGNYHMRYDWNYVMDSDSFVIRSPGDGSDEPITISIDWRLTRKASVNSARSTCD